MGLAKRDVVRQATIRIARSSFTQFTQSEGLMDVGGGVGRICTGQWLRPWLDRVAERHFQASRAGVAGDGGVRLHMKQVGMGWQQ